MSELARLTGLPKGRVSILANRLVVERLVWVGTERRAPTAGASSC